MPRVERAEAPAGELLLEDEVAGPGIGLEVEPAPRAEGVGAAQEEARVVVQAGEDARVVVAVRLGKKKGRKRCNSSTEEAEESRSLCMGG